MKIWVSCNLIRKEDGTSSNQWTSLITHYSELETLYGIVLRFHLGGLKNENRLKLEWMREITGS